MEQTLRFQKELLELVQKNNNTQMPNACSPPNPTPYHARHPISLPSLSLLSPFPFHLPPKHIITIYTFSTYCLPPSVFPLTAFSHSRQYVTPKTPLYLLVDHTSVPTKTPLYFLVDHTQRSPSTNDILKTSANLTQPPSPHITIYKSTTHLLLFL